MMTEIRVNYEKAINQMIVQGTSRQALFAFINDMVDGYGRAGAPLLSTSLMMLSIMIYQKRQKRLSLMPWKRLAVSVTANAGSDPVIII